MSLWGQTNIVTQRMNIALFWSTGYANNNLILHNITALFDGFSFWMIGNNIADLLVEIFLPCQVFAVCLSAKHDPKDE